MKTCPFCQDYCLYDETLDVCPHCGANLIQYEQQIVSSDAVLNAEGECSDYEQIGLSGVSASSDSMGIVHPVETVAVVDEMSPSFVHNEGGSIVFRGTISEVKSVTLYPTWLKKAIHVFTSGEPFQIGKPSQQTVVRLEQFHADSIATQKVNVVFYGSVDGYLTVGDDITVYADEINGRFVANRIYSNETEMDIPKDLLIPAPAFILMVIMPICILALCLGRAGYAMYSGITKGGLSSHIKILSATMITGAGAMAIVVKAIKKTVHKVLSFLKILVILLFLFLLVILFLVIS